MTNVSLVSTKTGACPKSLTFSKGLSWNSRPSSHDLRPAATNVSHVSLFSSAFRFRLSALQVSHLAHTFPLYSPVPYSPTPHSPSLPYPFSYRSATVRAIPNHTKGSEKRDTLQGRNYGFSQMRFSTILLAQNRRSFIEDSSLSRYFTAIDDPLNRWYEVIPIPEPASLTLLGLGAVLVLRRRRKNRVA